MINNMSPGSVIYDLAAIQGGNTALSKVDEVVEKNGVKIMGETNILNKLPTSASNLYSKNIFNFVMNLFDKKDNKININLDDEIIEKNFIKIIMEIDPFIFRLSIFILSIFVGYYVVWSVTPSLHTPLMSVTNAISSVIIVGAIIAALAGGAENIFEIANIFGYLAIILAAVNIFGGFLVTQRMLAMYKKKRRISKDDFSKFISNILSYIWSFVYPSSKRSFITRNCKARKFIRNNWYGNCYRRHNIFRW